MKKTIKLAVVAALALGTTSAFATNGDVMIGQGAESRAMGGVGIAKSFGASSGLANPAAINSVKDMEVEGALTMFMPSVTFGSNAQANAHPSMSGGSPAPITTEDSDASLSVIPEVAFAHRLTDRFVYGFSITGTAGMGTDYDDTKFGTASDNGSFRMKTALSLAKIAIPVSYQIDGFTMGITGVMQYGSLQMSHMAQTGFTGTQPNMQPTFELMESPNSSDIGYGLEFGATYDLSNMGVKGLTVGAVYKQEIGMTYEDTIGKSLVAFQANGAITSGDNLNQPAERGIGFSYSNSGNTLAFDYKVIQWGDAEGYADFGWENQDVYSVGYEYAGSGWAFRAGYNYAKNPIAEQDGSKGMTAQGPANYIGAVKNFFNMSGFPGIVESHYTIGAGYDITENFTLDGSFIYAAEITASYDTSAMTEAFVAGGAEANGYTPAQIAGAAGAAPTSTADVTHSQMALTLGASYRF